MNYEKEYYYAIRDVDIMRWAIASGWNMEANRISNNPGDWSRYEGERNIFEEWQRSLLESWDCHRDPHSMYKHLCDRLNMNTDPERVGKANNKNGFIELFI